MALRTCNAVVFKAECGEHIDDFCKDIVRIKENSSNNMVVIFQGIPMLIEVHEEITEAEIKEYMLRRITAMSNFSTTEVLNKWENKKFD